MYQAAPRTRRIINLDSKDFYSGSLRADQWGLIRFWPSGRRGRGHGLHSSFVSIIIHVSGILFPQKTNQSNTVFINMWQQHQPALRVHFEYTMNCSCPQSWVVKHDRSERNHVPAHLVNGRPLHHITQWWQFTGTHSVKCSTSTI